MNGRDRARAGREARAAPAAMLAHRASARAFCHRVHVARCIRHARSRRVRAELREVQGSGLGSPREHVRALERGPDLVHGQVDRAARRGCCRDRARLQAELRDRQHGQGSDAADSATKRAKKAR